MDAALEFPPKPQKGRNLFECCLPKSSPAAHEDDHTVQTEEEEKEEVKEFEDAKDQPLELVLPELDEEEDGTPYSPPSQSNIVISIWQIFLSFFFFNWVDSQLKSRKAIKSEEASNEHS